MIKFANIFFASVIIFFYYFVLNLSGIWETDSWTKWNLGREAKENRSH